MIMPAEVAARRSGRDPTRAWSFAARALLCASVLGAGSAGALDAADEAPGAVAPPAASTFVEVCRRDADACQLLVRMLVQLHLLLREFGGASCALLSHGGGRIERTGPGGAPRDEAAGR
jgi:hypothetical protein